MTCTMRSISSSEKGWLGSNTVERGEVSDGRQLSSCCQARQCGQRGEVIGVRSGLYGRGFTCRGLLSGKGWLKRCLGTSVFHKRFSNDVVVSALTGEGVFIGFLLAPSVV